MSWDKITKFVAGLIGAAAGLLGGWTMLLTILAWFMVIDYATGLIVAWRGRSPKSEHGGVSSKVGFDGLIRKAFIMLVVLMATLLDRAIGNQSSVFPDCRDHVLYRQRRNLHPGEHQSDGR